QLAQHGMGPVRPGLACKRCIEGGSGVLSDGVEDCPAAQRTGARADRLVASRLGHGARFVSDLKAEGRHELWEPSWASLHMHRWSDASLSWPSSMRRSDG